MNTKLVIRRKRVLPELNVRALAGPGLITLTVFLLALVAQQNSGISVDVLTEDAASQQHQAWFVGLISTLGICLLAAATAIAFFAGNFRKRIGGGPRKTSALMWLSFTTLLLLIDDAFLLHETVANTIPAIPEILVQAAIGFTLLATLVVFMRAIAPSLVYAAPALVCWTISVFADGLPSENNLNLVLLEDGTKFLGIVLWLTFIIDLANRYFANLYSENLSNR